MANRVIDGYVEDERGKFDRAAAEDRMRALVNEFERRTGTYLYGRRTYDDRLLGDRERS